MDLSPELQKKIRTILENEGDVDLAQLDALHEVGNKLDTVVAAIQSIPETEIPENEYPTAIEVLNLPEVQKVELVNPPAEKDDTEIKNLLKELVTEVKKKDEFAYDIEVDDALKAELRGEPGKDGEPGSTGKDGSPDTPDEVIEKVIESKKLIPRRKVEGLDELERRTDNSLKNSISYTTVRGIEANLQRQIDTKITGINIRTMYVSTDAPTSPQEYDVWIQIP